MSLADELLQTSDLPTKDIVCRGKNIRIRAMTSGETLDTQGKVARDKVLSENYCDLLIWCVQDAATGKPVFTEDHREALLKMRPEDSAELMDVVSQIQDLSRVHEDVELIEGAKKNSEPTPSSEST